MSKAGKGTPKGKPIPPDGNGKADRVLLIRVAPGETENAAAARTLLAPSTQAAITLRTWRPGAATQDINAVIEELQRQASATTGNNLGRVEAMLTIQAQTLDVIFNTLAQRAHSNMGEYLGAAERYMRLALKAQSQCRATIETLAEIKNPKPVAFVQQANIAAGPQQVNNGAAPGASRGCVRAGAGNPNQTNEVLEGGSYGNRLEQGTAGGGITGNSSLATLGQGDGAKVPIGEG